MRFKSARFGPECWNEIAEFPGLDVVVGRIPTVNASFDGVAVVANYEAIVVSD